MPRLLDQQLYEYLLAVKTPVAWKTILQAFSGTPGVEVRDAAHVLVERGIIRFSFDYGKEGTMVYLLQ